jgi:exonuclease III
MVKNGLQHNLNNVKALSLLTWNATGIMSSASYLHTILGTRNIDICGIAEHWLYEKDLHFWDSIHRDYKSHAVSDYDLVLPLFRKRAKGGIALLWKRSLDNCVTQLDISDDRIIGIRLRQDRDKYMFIFQVYLPSSSFCIDYYSKYICKLIDLYSVYSRQGWVVFMGDFNADLSPNAASPGRSKAFSGMLETCHMFSINTRQYCKGPKYTYRSYDNVSSSLIDHIVCSSPREDTVLHCEIADDVAINVSNHYPVWVKFAMPEWRLSDTLNNASKISYIWLKAGAAAKAQYSERVSEHCSTIISELDCSDSKGIDVLYDNITSGIKEASDSTIPVKGFKSYLKPYWNVNLKVMHKSMADCRRKWINDGRPRDKTITSCIAYKEAKCAFRREHRRAARLYLYELHDEVDRCAEVDSCAFYKLVNQRRKRYADHPGCEIKFGETVCRDPVDIGEKWVEYFQLLYTPNTSSNFNGALYEQVCSDLGVITSQNATADDVSPITHSEVANACAHLSTGKAGGHDSLTNEHIKYGGSSLHSALAYLLTAMVSHGHVPEKAKRGTIITLYKGGGKRKDSPNSYRAITLTPVITKLLERILLNRFQGLVGSQLPHSLQNGFLPSMNASMTSFVVSECARHKNEHGSKLYAAFLDAEKAFDSVWIDGLLWKLNNIGISGRYWNVVKSLYEGMHSCVVCNGYSSKFFPIMQGTRQGGVVSPWLFLVYIDGLLHSLSSINHGLSVNGLDCCAPTQADDITVLALSKDSLDKLLSCCHKYACDWRLRFNPDKSMVMIFNDNKSKDNRYRTWHLGNSVIKEVESVRHVGSMLTKDLSQKINVKNACQKARGSFLGLVNCGLHGDGFHPLTSLKIYQSVVLPSALYGSELWSNLPENSMLCLERVHHFCVKVLQGLPKRTRSDIALGLLGLGPLESYIHKRKLTFLGALCNLKRDCVVKRLFLMRLFESDFCTPQAMGGFIPDVWNILRAYGLDDTLRNFISTKVFPSSNSWKYLVKSKIRLRVERMWQSRLCLDRDLCRFGILQDKLCPNIWWVLSRRIPYALRSCRCVVKLCSVPPGQTPMTCSSCGLNTSDCVRHLLSCSGIIPHSLRERFWSDIIDTFGVHVYMYLDTLDEHDLITGLLAMPNAIVERFGAEEFIDFMTMVAHHLAKLCLATFPLLCTGNCF